MSVFTAVGVAGGVSFAKDEDDQRCFAASQACAVLLDTWLWFSDVAGTGEALRPCLALSSLALVRTAYCVIAIVVNWDPALGDWCAPKLRTRVVSGSVW